MYRVELKVFRDPPPFRLGRVPNVPCGVERKSVSKDLITTSKFLMYRVELKVILAILPPIELRRS